MLAGCFDGLQQTVVPASQLHAFRIKAGFHVMQVVWVHGEGATKKCGLANGYLFVFFELSIIQPTINTFAVQQFFVFADVDYLAIF